LTYSHELENNYYSGYAVLGQLWWHCVNFCT